MIYLAADVGSIGGGWLSSSLIARGWTVNRARKTAMLVCALAVVPIVFASSARQPLARGVARRPGGGGAPGLVGESLHARRRTCFRGTAVGSVVGFGGMTGAIGGMLIAKVTGYVLQATGSYVPVFIVAGCAYLVALGVIHLLAPRLEPVRLGA